MPPHFIAVESQLSGRLIDQRLDGRHGLIMPGTALCGSRRRVGLHCNAAPPHGRGLIKDGNRIAGRWPIGKAGRWTVFLHDVHIGRGNATVSCKSHSDPTLETRARGTEIIFLGTADPHHDGTVDLPGHVRGNRHDRISRSFRAETTAAGFGNVNEILDIDTDEPCEIRYDVALTLGRAVQETLPVLPIGHRGSRLHGMMRHAGRDEAFVDDDCRFLETCLEIAIRPLGDGLARRQLTLAHGREVGRGPFHLFQRRRTGETIVHHVATQASVWTAGIQTLERVDSKRQRLEVQFDCLDRIVGNRLAYSGDCEYRLTDEHRLVRQDGERRSRERRHIVGRQNVDHTLHGECPRCIDIAHTRVRHRANHEPAKDHALHPEIFGKLGPARHLAPHIRRHEILTE